MFAYQDDEEHKKARGAELEYESLKVSKYLLIHSFIYLFLHSLSHYGKPV